VSVDSAADPQDHDNASAAARRARQREAAQAYGEYLRRRSAEQAEDDRLMIEHSNDIALHDAQW
jgi:hypothetical protein